MDTMSPLHNVYGVLHNDTTTALLTMLYNTNYLSLKDWNQWDMRSIVEEVSVCEIKFEC